MKKVDVLDLEYASKGRDVDIAEPVLSYLEIKYGLNIVRKCCFKDWQYYLLKYSPKIVFIANGVGSLPHFNIVKTAHFLGIKVVTHTSEGDYTETQGATKVLFWGHNHDNVLYEDLHLEWSQRNIDLFLQYIRTFDNIKLSGGIVFDKYKLLSDRFLHKTNFIKRYGKNDFSKIVGIAGWGFDSLYHDNEYVTFLGGVSCLNKTRKSKDLVKEILKKLIKANPDILFVLKYHPMSIDKTLTEFYGLEDEPNTLVLKTEETIYDVINVCDIWGAYESTTAMESWLIHNNPTFIIQPIEDDFVRSKIASGSPALRNENEIQDFIDEYYATGKVDSFDKLAQQREAIITRVIQWSDGKNHQRAAEYIYELYKNPAKKHLKINFYVLRIYTRFVYKKFTRQIRRLLFLPLYNDNRFNDKEREEWHQIYKEAIIKFHNFKVSQN
ncbi:MAG: hypothetical protein LBS69_04280 [Prevotellaceae bacterium]|jgi:hypothetical protein|nr:hypothetical protein [Prevotellaceae bacterium]